MVIGLALNVSFPVKMRILGGTFCLKYSGTKIDR